MPAVSPSMYAWLLFKTKVMWNAGQVYRNSLRAGARDRLLDRLLLPVIIGDSKPVNDVIPAARPWKREVRLFSTGGKSQWETN